MQEDVWRDSIWGLLGQDIPPGREVLRLHPCVSRQGLRQIESTAPWQHQGTGKAPEDTPYIPRGPLKRREVVRAMIECKAGGAAGK